MAKKIVLIDGHSILNRAFYGVPNLSNSAGLHTNAIFGFMNILLKVLEEEQADYLTVAFDVKHPTFRHEMYEAYKGTRKPMPEELHEQVPVMKELLTAMGISVVEQPGLEADDIIGTISKMAEEQGFEVSIVSGDRDLLQLVSEHVKLRMPKTKGGRTEVEDYYPADVQSKYQVTPAQIVDLKALMGDASDNIPGLPKVGEKTATELIVRYGTIESVREHAAEISKKSIRETVENNFALAELSKKLATINRHGDISYDIEKAKLGRLYTEEAYAVMKRLELKKLLGRFDSMPETAVADEIACREVTALTEAEALFEKAMQASEIGFHIFAEDGHMKGLSLAVTEDEACFLPAEGFLTEEYLAGHLQALTKAGKTLAAFDIKAAQPWLSAGSPQGLFDILIAAYLLNPLKNDYAMEDIAGEHLNLMIKGKGELFGKRSLAQVREQEAQDFLRYACYCAHVPRQARAVLSEKLTQAGMYRLFTDIEMPLLLCLYDMEREGIALMPEELKAYGDRLSGRIAELEQSIHSQAGEEFNINSPKQLGEVLFGRLQMPGGKKTKTGYSTAADVLDKLAPDYPIVADILEYRTLSKLKSTYAEGLYQCVADDGRIHSTFNQTITATGRISSTEPNLQNIPVRVELGRLIRKVFVPREGFVFTDADYSQIELRILAHMSGDERLIEAYNQDEDIHRITASQVFHTPFEEVTDLQRRNAKAVNFGIVYGISSFGLSQDLSITRKEAKEYIDNYYETYPGIKAFLDRQVQEAKEKGYVTTLFGRRRPVPELSSSNFMQRSFGERVAMNAPIQGTAADIIKVAMIRVHRRLTEAGMRSRLILQVHDELLIETAEEELSAVQDILREEMQGAADLKVRLEIDMHTGNNWYEAK